MNYDIEQFFLAAWLLPSAARQLSKLSGSGAAPIDLVRIQASAEPAHRHGRLGDGPRTITNRCSILRGEFTRARK
jgi:hypothetical protein